MTNIPSISSLSELHEYVKKHPKKDEIFIFFDFDMTLINDMKDTLLEPQITKDLFKYLQDHGIYHAVVTARFYDTVCNKSKRNLQDMEENIFETIHPILEELGMDLNVYKGEDLKDTVMELFNDKRKCVGILYRGIFFGDKKGEIIKHFLKNSGVNKEHIIFVDDYDPYLDNVRKHVPHCLSVKRLYYNLI